MMNGKMGRCLWIVILASSVLVAYWTGTKRSVQSNPAETPLSVMGSTDAPLVRGLIDTSKYGMYRVLKDQNDPSKGWTDWVFVPRTSPEVLLEAERARAADRVAQDNRAKQEAAARLAQDNQWYAARDSDRRHTEEMEQIRASERDSQRRHQVALEQARQAQKPQVVVVRPQSDWRSYMSYDYNYFHRSYDRQLNEIRRDVDDLSEEQRRIRIWGK